VRGADAVTVPGGVRGWEVLRRFGTRLTWDRTLRAAHEAAGGVPVARSLATHIAHPENADLWGTEDFDRVFRPGGRSLQVGEQLKQPALALTIGTLRERGPDVFYEGELADRIVEYLRSHGSCFTADDFGEFQPEITEPIAVGFRGLTVMTSPPNTHGFLLLRALRAIEELGVTDPLGNGLGTLMRIFHRGNQLRQRTLADPRHAGIDLEALVHGDLLGLGEPAGAKAEPSRAPHGDTVGIAAADSDGYAVSLIQSVYDAFGSGLIDPETGILFHNRGTGFTLDEASVNVIAPRKRPAHTLMPTMTTQHSAVRHVLSTMGGQGQPQIIAQLLLRAVWGERAEAVVAAPRAVVGRQSDGGTADTVSVEADMSAVARDSLGRSGLPVTEVAPRTEALGQANVVFTGPDGAMTAASDPR
jgi:gamma-glutamyltranspeptidase